MFHLRSPAVLQAKISGEDSVQKGCTNPFHIANIICWEEKKDSQTADLLSILAGSCWFLPFLPSGLETIRTKHSLI